MRKLGGIFAATCLLTWVAGCSGGSTTAAPATTSAPSSSTSASVSKPKTTTATPTPTFAAAVSPSKVTGACPFLGSIELRQVVGDGNKSSDESTEGPAQNVGSGKAYQCTYPGRGAKLYVAALPGGPSPSAMIGTLTKKCGEAATPVPGAGDTAARCKMADGAEMVVVGKHSHGQLRVAQLFIAPTRTDVYDSLAKLLGGRL
ncbi:hypothetical protein ABJI51_26245 [Amycolatopsis sp. NEAU-NG30]|uniref:DUF3558 domain-containing protein n=1 Tax=Amycolatopsis melonis TaxID=3156488 RepID=A0ABV0LGQ1_9PSEU